MTKMHTCLLMGNVWIATIDGAVKGLAECVSTLCKQGYIEPPGLLDYIDDLVEKFVPKSRKQDSPDSNFMIISEGKSIAFFRYEEQAKLFLCGQYAKAARDYFPNGGLVEMSMMLNGTKDDIYHSSFGTLELARSGR